MGIEIGDVLEVVDSLDLDRTSLLTIKRVIKKPKVREFWFGFGNDGGHYSSNFAERGNTTTTMENHYKITITDGTPSIEVVK